jgi:molybdopterin-binding protein
MEEQIMKLSARNVLKGKVKSIVIGMVNAELVIELPEGTEITSIITKTSAESMKLKVGSEVYATFKASSVMIAID